MIGFEWTAAKFLWYLFFMYFTLLYFTLYGMMTVAATPNQTIAAIVSTAFYMIWNLFSGFVIPKTVSPSTNSCAFSCITKAWLITEKIPFSLEWQRIPMWWRWYYYICPISWTIYWLVASQYGDIKDKLETGETVQQFVKSYYGFEHDFVGLVAAIIVGITVLFGFIFAFSIKAFNFQKR